MISHKKNFIKGENWKNIPQKYWNTLELLEIKQRNISAIFTKHFSVVVIFYANIGKITIYTNSKGALFSFD